MHYLDIAELKDNEQQYIMEKIDSLYQRAAERKGGTAVLNLLLGEAQQDNLVAELSDDRILSAFTKKI